MPIDPSEYPPDWPEISQRIRDRDGHCCKFCGVAQHATGWRDQRGNFHALAEGQTAPASVKTVRIVLTVAHLDHDTANNGDENLAALCQRCHLRHDRKQHRATAGRRRRGRRRLSGQMELL
jgi:5-methylcytosine-specific restriction endonuclease McrA